MLRWSNLLKITIFDSTYFRFLDFLSYMTDPSSAESALQRSMEVELVGGDF